MGYKYFYVLQAIFTNRLKLNCVENPQCCNKFNGIINTYYCRYACMMHGPQCMVKWEVKCLQREKSTCMSYQ